MKAKPKPRGRISCFDQAFVPEASLLKEIKQHEMTKNEFAEFRNQNLVSPAMTGIPPNILVKLSELEGELKDLRKNVETLNKQVVAIQQGFYKLANEAYQTSLGRI